MTYMDGLTIAANWATILTAAIVRTAFSRFLWGRRQRRNSLEAYLREEKLSRRDEGRRSVIHLMASLAMTEAEILAAAFQRNRITTVPGIDDNGRASRLLLNMMTTICQHRRSSKLFEGYALGGGGFDPCSRHYNSLPTQIFCLPRHFADERGRTRSYSSV